MITALITKKTWFSEIRLLAISKALIWLLSAYLIAAMLCFIGILGIWLSQTSLLLIVFIATTTVIASLWCLRDLRRRAADGTFPMVAMAGFLAGGMVFGAMAANLVRDMAHPPPAVLPAHVVSVLKVTATGKKVSTTAKGSEVWFYGAYLADGRKIPWERFEIDPSWERRGEVFVSYQHQPATMTLRGRFEEPLSLHFGAHEWSGEVAVDWDGDIHTHILYANPAKTEVTIAVNSWPHLGLLASLYYPAIAIAAGLFWLIGVILMLNLPHSWRRLGVLILFFIPIYWIATAAAPGIYTRDSVDQLQQARSGIYSDGHPPLMAALWSVLITVTGSPASLFWLHLVLFTIGFLLWGYAFIRAGISAATGFLLLFSFSPWWLNFAGVIWKDVGMAAALFAGFAVLAVSRSLAKGAIPAAATAMLLAFYSLGVRWNSLPAVLPLLYLAVAPFIHRTGWRRQVMAGGITVGIAGLLLALNWAIAYKLLDSKQEHLEQFVQLYDIAGIAVQTGTDYFPTPFKTEHFSLERLTQTYELDRCDHLFDAYYKDGPLQFTTDPNALAELKRAWRQAITEAPMAYFRHRTSVFFSLLRFGYNSPYFYYVDFKEARGWLAAQGEGSQSLLPGNSLATQYLTSSIRWFSERLPLFYGWFWLIVLSSVIIISLFLRHQPLAGIAMALAISGLAYIPPYYFIVPSSGLRYIYWSILAGSMGVVILAGIMIQRMFIRSGSSWITKAIPDRT